MAHEPARRLIISCGILRQELEALVERKEIDADLIFLNRSLHMDFGKLHKALRAALIKYRGRRPIVLYGDLCLGFNNEMRDLMSEFGTEKVDCLNCIDCLLGGRLLEIDPNHEFFFITPSTLDMVEKIISGNREEDTRLFSMLTGMVIVDSMNNIDDYRCRIDYLCNQTGLQVKRYEPVRLSGLKTLLVNSGVKPTFLTHEHCGGHAADVSKHR